MRLALGVIVLVLAGCAMQPPGPNRYQLEFNAYVQYLDAEVRAGRMTPEQGKYPAVVKYNQLRSQLDAENAAEGARIGNAFQDAGRMLMRSP